MTARSAAGRERGLVGQDVFPHGIACTAVEEGDVVATSLRLERSM